jgi:acyl-CoA thioester hydrolase
MGIVYYSNYFVYFEVARTEHFRDLGIEYKELEKKGIYLVVLEALCNYILPARYDDLLEIKTSFRKNDKSKLQFDYMVLNLSLSTLSKEKSSATGYTTHVFVNKNARPIKIPGPIEKFL